MPRLDSSFFFAIAGGASVAAWLVGTVLGKHPDGGLLGFSAGMFAVWSAMRKDSERRDDQRRRVDDGGGKEGQEWPDRQDPLEDDDEA